MHLTPRICPGFHFDPKDDDDDVNFGKTSTSAKRKTLQIPVAEMVSRFWSENEHGRAMMQV